MEGIGYWLFLAVLYLLSSLMKKRQQKGAREKLDDEPAIEEKETESGFKFDFLKEIYNEFQETSEEDLGASYGESDIDEDIEPEWVEPEPIQKETREQGKAVFDDISSPAHIHTVPGIGHASDRSTHVLYRNQLFQNINDLKRAVIMKEILDKPRALRRSIR
jgi:hypothetical protein